MNSGSSPRALLIAALLVIAEPRHAFSWQPAVFQASAFRNCQEIVWQARSDRSVKGRLLGFSGCSKESGWHGNGTPNDPFRLALDGKRETVDVDGLMVSTGSDYTVQAWFRVRSNKPGLVMLVDSRLDRFYVPLRMRISDGKLQCSIEMPFPDRIYLTSASVPIAMNRWQNAACRYDAKSRTLSLFLNGRITGSTRVPPGTIRSNHIRIGGDPSVDGEYFAGDIAEVVFSTKSEEASAILARCREASQRFAGAECSR